jgi:hypothetical protein
MRRVRGASKEAAMQEELLVMTPALAVPAGRSLLGRRGRARGLRRVAALLTLAGFALGGPATAMARDTEAAALIVSILGFGASPPGAQERTKTDGRAERSPKRGFRSLAELVRSPEDKTKIRKKVPAGDPASSAKAGDSVTVSSTERGGKVVAQGPVGRGTEHLASKGPAAKP